MFVQMGAKLPTIQLTPPGTPKLENQELWTMSEIRGPDFIFLFVSDLEYAYVGKNANTFLPIV